MGFHKKYISIQIIERLVKDGQNLKEFFNKSDAIIFTDDTSLEIYNLVMLNKSYQHLIK